MLAHRIIPLLLVSGEDLVKTRQFGGRRYLGDPLNAINIFNTKQVDELILLDIDASRNGTGPNFDLVDQVASECFMPLAYGGGIHSAEEAAAVFDLGVEKICINSAFRRDPGLVSSIAARYGSQAVVVSIDVDHGADGDYRVVTQGGSGAWDSLEQAIGGAIEAGAGEVLLTCIPREGTMRGMDLDLIRRISSVCSVPLIANGGVGSLRDIRAAIAAGADAISTGAFVVYKGPLDAVLITYPEYQTLETELS